MKSVEKVRVLTFAACLAFAILPANAQIDPNSGPLVAPLQREPTIGLPEQAPEPTGAPAVPAAPPARAAPRPTAEQPTQRPAAAASATDWHSECGEGERKDMCQAIVRSKVGEQVALVMAVARPSAEAGSRLQIALPLGVDVARGATLTIGTFSQALKISRCTAQGCIVEDAASDELLEAMRRGSIGKVTVYSVDDNAIDLPLPLDGAAKSLADAKVFG